LYETRKAIARLKEDSGLQEVLLKPQNSFIRREQHVVISDAGFGTESRGEGKERAVCIIRAK
jgi:predicted RNA-binding protein Jag